MIPTGSLRQALQNAIVRKGSRYLLLRFNPFGNLDGFISLGGVPELADGPDLGSGAAMRGGSSPPFPTILCNLVISLP